MSRTKTAIVGACAALAVCTGALAQPAGAAADTSELVRLCYVDENARQQSGTLLSTPYGPLLLVLEDNVLCIELETVSRRGPALDRTQIDTAFPHVAGRLLEDRFAVVQCGERGATAVGQRNPSRAGGHGSVGSLGRDQASMLDGCGGELGGSVSGGGIGDMLGAGVQGPSSAAMQCSGGGPANPYAHVTDMPVRNLDPDDSKLFNAGWSIYRLLTKQFNGILDSDVTDNAENWKRYFSDQEEIKMDFAADWAEDSAYSAVKDALEARNAAAGAESAAKASGDPDAAAHAADARAAAERAVDHAAKSTEYAANARRAANLTEAVKEWAKAQEEARKAAEERKKAEDSAKKAKAKKTPAGGAADAGTPDAGETRPVAGPSTGSSSLCADLQRFIWECEQSGWKTGPCLLFLNMLNGCVDLTIARVSEDGALTCGQEQLTSEQMEAALRASCEIDKQPVPGHDPCDPTPPPPPGAAPSPDPIGCDPTIARTIDGGGCPPADPTEAPAPAGPDCPPAPPGVPPVPCPTIGGGPGPGPKRGDTDVLEPAIGATMSQPQLSLPVINANPVASTVPPAGDVPAVGGQPVELP